MMGMGKRISSVAIAVVLVAVASGTAMPLEAAGVVRIRMATLAPRGSSWHKSLQQMGAEWRAATNGEVTLRIYPGGVLGGESAVIRDMRMGAPDAAAITNDGLAEIDRDAFALNMPLVFANYEEWDYVRERVNPRLEEKLAARGFIVLTWSDVGWVRFFTKEPLRHPDDLKGMKLAASANDPDELALFKSLGFNPVPITTMDVVTGLQTGLVDSMYLPIIMASASNLYREVQYMTVLEWAPLQGAVIIKKEMWDLLPAAHREAMQRISRKIGAEQRVANRADEAAALQAMVARGLQVVELDDETAAAWQQLANDTYPKVRGELVDEDMFDAVMALRDRYRIERFGGYWLVALSALR